MLKYETVKQLIAKWAGDGGKHPDSPDVDIFAQQILQQVLWSGAYGGIRKFEMCATNGCITLPYELEVPMQIKVDDSAMTDVLNRWYNVSTYGDLNGYLSCSSALIEDPNTYSVVHEPPSTGFRPAVQGTFDEAEDANVIIRGQDLQGREVYSVVDGVKRAGIYLAVKKGVLVISDIVLGKILSISSYNTQGYILVYSCVPNCDLLNVQARYISEVAPHMENVEYRRYYLRTPRKGIHRVYIIGRVRLKQKYYKEDLIPLENMGAIVSAAQSASSSNGGDVQTAVVQNQLMTGFVASESSFKKVNQNQPIKTDKTVAPGSLRGVLGRGGSRRPVKITRR